MRLREFEVRWGGTIGRALLPKGMLGGAVDDVDLGEALRNDCRISPWYAALVLRVSLWMTWFSPLWLGTRERRTPRARRRFTTFGALDPGAREATLETLLASPHYVVRSTALYFKLTACLALLGDERALLHVGAYEHGRLRTIDARA